MSYVLEALRKSERERQQASGEGSSMLHPVMPDRQTPLRLWPLLVLAVVVAAGAAAWLWWPQPRPAGAISRAVPETAMRPLPPPRPTPSVPQPQSAAGRMTTPAAATTKPAATVVAPTASVPAAAMPGPDGATKLAADLPAALQKELPPLAIQGYVRDAETGDVAIIDDRLVHEGEELAPGLRLEKILPDGAEFSFKGYRFRR